MSNYNDDYDREAEDRILFEAQEEAEERAEAEYYEAQQYEEDLFIFEQMLHTFIFGLYKGNVVDEGRTNWIFDIKVELL